MGQNNSEILKSLVLQGFSGVALLLWEQRVAGSNPATPTIKPKKKPRKSSTYRGTLKGIRSLHDLKILNFTDFQRQKLGQIGAKNFMSGAAGLLGRTSAFTNPFPRKPLPPGSTPSPEKGRGKFAVAFTFSHRLERPPGQDTIRSREDSIHPEGSVTPKVRNTLTSIRPAGLSISRSTTRSAGAPLSSSSPWTLPTKPHIRDLQPGCEGSIFNTILSATAGASGMARVNVDDDIESREEFWRLIGVVKDRDAALGKLVRFFRLAQKHFGRGEAVTESELKTAGLECMIESGWAVKFRDGFQALGAEKQFSWYQQKVDAGKKGGRPRKLDPGFIPEEPEEQNRPVFSDIHPDNFDNRKTNFENPPAPAPSLSPTDLSKKVLPESVPDSASLSSIKPTRADFERVYRDVYPLKEGKAKGIERCLKTIRSRADFIRFEKAVRNYAKRQQRIPGPDEFLPQTMHFKTFVGCWTDYENVAEPPNRKGMSIVAEIDPLTGKATCYVPGPIPLTTVPLEED